MGWLILLFAMLSLAALHLFLPASLAGKPTELLLRVALPAGILAIGNGMMLAAQMGGGDDRVQLILDHLALVFGLAFVLILATDFLTRPLRPGRSLAWLIAGCALFLILFVFLPATFLAFRTKGSLSFYSTESLLYCAIVCAGAVEWWARLPRRITAR